LDEILAVTDLPVWIMAFTTCPRLACHNEHREAEGSSYYRHFYMGLLREGSVPKLAYRDFSHYTPDFGICRELADFCGSMTRR
jgi:beta-xylosidase